MGGGRSVVDGRLLLRLDGGLLLSGCGCERNCVKLLVERVAIVMRAVYAVQEQPCEVA